VEQEKDDYRDFNVDDNSAAIYSLVGGGGGTRTGAIFLSSFSSSFVIIIFSFAQLSSCSFSAPKVKQVEGENKVLYYAH